MNLSRLRHSGNTLAVWLVTAKSGKDLFCGHDVVSSAGFSTLGNIGKVFAGHTFFKGKAALSLNPIGPKLDKIDSGIRIMKPGAVLLTFWPAIGTRKYDWQKRQVISLSPMEVGSLISLAADESCDFCHDTSKIASISSQSIKRLSVQPLSGDGHGHMFNLSVANSILKTNDRFSVPVSKGEFAVIRTACSYILPHIMGWDLISGQANQMFANPFKSAHSVKHSKSVDKEFANPELEWER